MVHKTRDKMSVQIFRVDGEPEEIWVEAADREAATDFATKLFPSPEYHLHSNGVTNGGTIFTFLIEAQQVQAPVEKQQFGVEITRPDGKKYVDTMFNGGFMSPENALAAAKTGYQYVGAAVERTITTVFGPWRRIPTEETDA